MGKLRNLLLALLMLAGLLMLLYGGVFFLSAISGGESPWLAGGVAFLGTLSIIVSYTLDKKTIVDIKQRQPSLLRRVLGTISILIGVFVILAFIANFPSSGSIYFVYIMLGAALFFFVIGYLLKRPKRIDEEQETEVDCG